MKMPMPPLYIAASCIVRNHQLVVDGRVVLANETGLSLGDWLKAAYQQASMDYPKFYKMDALAKATLIAVEWISRSVPIASSNTPLVFSNYSSSMVSDDRHAASIYDPDDASASPAVFVYTLPNIAMGEVSIRHQLHSENVFFIFERFTPQFLVPYVTGMLERENVQQVLAGWVEVGADGICDVLLYAVSRHGTVPHTIEQLNALYNKDYE